MSNVECKTGKSRLDDGPDVRDINTRPVSIEIGCFMAKVSRIMEQLLRIS